MAVVILTDAEPFDRHLQGCEQDLLGEQRTAGGLPLLTAMQVSRVDWRALGASREGSARSSWKASRVT